MTPTPLEKLLHKKVWTLLQLRAKVKKTISYPTLINIKRGYREVKGERIAYKPNQRTLQAIATVFNVPVSQIYEPRHND